MTLIDVLFCFFIISAVILYTYYFIRFLKRRRKLKELGKPLSLLKGSFDKPMTYTILLASFLMIAYLIIILVTFIILSINNSESYTYNTVNVTTSSQNIMFKEQTTDGYLVTIDNQEYLCTELIISDDITSIQVICKTHKWKNGIVRFFLSAPFKPTDDVYELHIPINYLNPNH